MLQAAEDATEGTKAAPGDKPEGKVASEHPLEELGAAASLRRSTSAEQREDYPRQSAPSPLLEAAQEQDGKERPPAPAAAAEGAPDQALEEAGRLVRSCCLSMRGLVCFEPPAKCTLHHQLAEGGSHVACNYPTAHQRFDVSGGHALDSCSTLSGFSIHC